MAALVCDICGGKLIMGVEALPFAIVVAWNTTQTE